MNRLLSILIAGLILTSFTACGQPTSPQSESGPIKIGVVLPLTGIASFHGNNEKEGFELALQEINADGGINGRPLELIYEDDNTAAKTTVTAINKLIAQDGVQIILGITWDFLANAAIPVLDRESVVAISPSVLGDTITVRSPYFFSAYPPVKFQKDTILPLLADFTDATAVVMGVNTPWGLAYVNTYKDALAESGHKVVKTILLPEFDNNDLQTELTTIKNLNPDLLLVSLNHADAVNFGRKLKELDINPTVLVNQNFANALIDGKLPFSAAEGFYVTTYVEPQPWFVEKFKAYHGKEPLEYADSAYDSLHILAQAIAKVGYDANRLKDALHTEEFAGATGLLRFDAENNSTAKETKLLVIKNSNFIPYEK